MKTKKVNFYEIVSLIDLGGLALLCAGFAMFFLPISLASTTPSNWRTSWIIALIVIGALLLIALVPYEAYIAKHPVLPPRYFRSISITLAISIGFLDTVCFSASHTYLYSWVVVSHNYNATKATFFIYLNGIVQSLIAMIAGLVIYRFRRYKWIIFSATVIRTAGYGLMIKLRGDNNSDAELFAVQAVQGIGSGVIQMICLTVAQIVVPHAELAQISALVLLAVFLGYGVGSAIAGGIYTNYFKSALHSRLGNGATDSLVDSVYNSILAADLPTWGSTQRVAVNAAVSRRMLSMITTI